MDVGTLHFYNPSQKHERLVAYSTYGVALKLLLTVLYAITQYSLRYSFFFQFYQKKYVIYMAIKGLGKRLLIFSVVYYFAFVVFFNSCRPFRWKLVSFLFVTN